MSVIPPGQQPQRESSTSTNVTETIYTVLALGAIILGAIPLLGGVDTLLSALSHDLPDKSVSMIVLSGFAGIFAGIAGAVVTSLPFKVHPLGKSSLSAYFSRSLANVQFDATFWGRIAIGGLVGWMVGAWLASAGFTSAPELLHGVYTLDNLVPMSSGGFGGDPPPASLLGIVFLLLLALLAAPLAGLISGSLVSIALSMLGGFTKGAVKAYIGNLLTDPQMPRFNGIRAGALGGLVIGLIAGIIQALCSALGIIRFAA